MTIPTGPVERPPDLSETVAAAVLAVPGVAGLHGGAFGDVATYLPGARIAGASAPPFRDLTPAEEEQLVDELRASGADIVWVGLGMPRQELFMRRMAERLPGITLIGVGAAFDLLSGTVPQAPAWLQRVGLEWLFRLAQEPRRLWRRYIVNNPAYLVLGSWQVLRDRARRTRGGRVAGAQLWARHPDHDDRTPRPAPTGRADSRERRDDGFTISLRTGCFCNPGAGEGAFALTGSPLRGSRRGGAREMGKSFLRKGLGGNIVFRP